jgi:hypothetical protein
MLYSRVCADASFSEQGTEYHQFKRFMEARNLGIPHSHPNNTSCCKPGGTNARCNAWNEMMEAPWKTTITFDAMGGLDNPIHPILARGKFELMNDVYEHSKPALQLVSLWLTHTSFRPFFEHLATATVAYPSPELGSTFVAPEGQFLTPIQKTEAVERMFNDLEKVVSFGFYEGRHVEGEEDEDESY